MEILLTHVPNPTKQIEGTTLGTALTSAPKGRLFWESSQNHCARAKRTQSLREPFLTKLNAWAELVYRVLSDSGGLSAVSAHATEVLEQLVGLDSDYSELAQHGLPRFVAKVDDEIISKPVGLWCGGIMAAWINLLRGVIHAKCEAKTVINFFRDDSGLIHAQDCLIKWSGSLARCKHIVDIEGDEHYLDVQRARYQSLQDSGRPRIRFWRK